MAADAETDARGYDDERGEVGGFGATAGKVQVRSLGPHLQLLLLMTGIDTALVMHCCCGMRCHFHGQKGRHRSLHPHIGCLMQSRDIALAGCTVLRLILYRLLESWAHVQAMRMHQVPSSNQGLCIFLYRVVETPSLQQQIWPVPHPLLRQMAQPSSPRTLLARGSFNTSLTWSQVFLVQLSGFEFRETRHVQAFSGMGHASAQLARCQPLTSIHATQADLGS